MEASSTTTVVSVVVESRRPSGKPHRDQQIFASPQTKDELRKLREEGWSFQRLGVHFGVDHTTIIYHLRRMQLVAPRRSEDVYFLSKRSQEPIKKETGGKSYKDYLRDSFKQPSVRSYYEQYNITKAEQAIKAIRAAKELYKQYDSNTVE